MLITSDSIMNTLNSDLASTAADGAASTAAGTSRDYTSHDPSAGFNALWGEALKTQARIATEMSNLEAAATRLLGRPIALTTVPDMAGPFAVLKHNMVDCLEKTAMATMVPAQMTVRPDQSMKADALRVADQDFDPEDYWSKMRARYGAGKGADVACEQVVEQLVRDLRLSKHAPTRKKTTLTMKIKADTDSDRRGGFSLEYDTFDRMCRILAGLATFCTWAGNEEAARKIAAYRATEFDRRLQLRQPHDLGGIVVTYGYTFVELRLRTDLGDRFQEFVSTFAGNAFAE